MNNRPDQKDTLTDIAELQNDPGSPRGQDFVVENANSERDRYAAKDKGKSELTAGAPPHKRKSAGRK